MIIWKCQKPSIFWASDIKWPHHISAALTARLQIGWGRSSWHDHTKKMPAGFLCSKKPVFMRLCGLLRNWKNYYDLKVSSFLTSPKGVTPSHFPLICLDFRHISVTISLHNFSKSRLTWSSKVVTRVVSSTVVNSAQQTVNFGLRGINRRMSVIIHGHFNAGMAHNCLQGFGIHSSICHFCTECVPIGYNKDKSEIPRKIKGNRVCLYSFSSKKRVVKSRKRVQ